MRYAKKTAAAPQPAPSPAPIIGATIKQVPWRQRRVPASAITFAPVPEAMADLLKQRLLPDRKLFEYGFRFVSHLLAHAGDRDGWRDGHFVPQEVRADHLAQASDDGKVKRMTEALIENHIIEVVNPADRLDYVYKPRRTPAGTPVVSKKATTYRIHSDLKDGLRKAKRWRRFSTPSNCLNRKPHQADPQQILDPSLQNSGLDRRFLKAVKDLQATPIKCDVLALLAYIAADDDLWKKWSYLLHQLDDGDNYTSYLLAEAGGRLFTKTPNLQGLSKDLRQFFKPPQGWVFIDFDWANQESWLIAHISRDENLLAALGDGDLYQQVADYLAKRDARVTRDNAKVAVNAYWYGARTKRLTRNLLGLASDAEPSREDYKVASRFRRYMRTKFPGAHTWIKVMTARVKLERQAVAPIGGQVLTGIDPKRARTQGINHLVQASGATLLRTTLVILGAAPDGVCKVVLPFHDGVLVQARADKVDDAMEAVTAAMNEACSKHLDGLIIRVKPPVIGWGTPHGSPPTTSAGVP